MFDKIASSTSKTRNMLRSASKSTEKYQENLETNDDLNSIENPAKGDRIILTPRRRSPRKANKSSSPKKVEDSNTNGQSPLPSGNNEDNKTEALTNDFLKKRISELEKQVYVNKELVRVC